MIRLKRKFDPAEIEAWRESGGPAPAPTHLEVQEQRGDRQNFSDRFVDAGIVEGWISLGGGGLRLRTAPDIEDVAFKVLEVPGAYCCHCGVKLQGGNDIAQAHVAEHHPDHESPDPENPSGYRVSHAYRCEVI